METIESVFARLYESGGLDACRRWACRCIRECRRDGEMGVVADLLAGSPWLEVLDAPALAVELEQPYTPNARGDSDFNRYNAEMAAYYLTINTQEAIRNAVRLCIKASQHPDPSPDFKQRFVIHQRHREDAEKQCVEIAQAMLREMIPA